MREEIDEATGITNRVVIDWRASRAAATCVRASSSTTPTASRSCWPTARRRATCCRSARSSRSRTARRSRPATCWRVSRAKAARPATSPAVCRAWPSCSRRASPKDYAIIAEIDGRVEFGKDYKNKRRIVIVPDDEGAEPVEYLIPKGKLIDVQEGDFVKRGDKLIDGNPVPHDILRVLGHRGAGRVSRERDPGGLSTAGREDQRQAHRGDRSPDAAEGRDHRRRRHDLPGRRAGRRGEIDRATPSCVAEKQKPAKASRCCSASPRRRLQTAASSRRRRSRRRPACSPRRPSRARSTRCRASRRTSSSAG